MDNVKQPRQFGAAGIVPLAFGARRRGFVPVLIDTRAIRNHPILLKTLIERHF